MNEQQLAELERIRSWACCFEPERRFMAEIRVAQLEDEHTSLENDFISTMETLRKTNIRNEQLEAENEALREYVPEHVKREWEHYRALQEASK